MILGDASPLFNLLIAEIEDEYLNLGHTLGWRFLNVSKTVLNGPTRIALITINPAGDHIPEDHPSASCEQGSSYLVESWGSDAQGKSTLQVQVQLLFSALAAEIGYMGPSAQLLEESLISQFVPFRSPRFALLPKQTESLDFSRNLWSRILPIVSPRLVVCLGRDIQCELLTLLPGSLGVKKIGTESFPTGWGTYTAEVTTFDKEGMSVRLLYLPHLSTWTLFTTKKCHSYLSAIIHAAAKDV